MKHILTTKQAADISEELGVTLIQGDTAIIYGGSFVDNLISTQKNPPKYAIGVCTAGTGGWNRFPQIAFFRGEENLPIQEWAQEYYPNNHDDVRRKTKFICQLLVDGIVQQKGLPWIRHGK